MASILFIFQLNTNYRDGVSKNYSNINFHENPSEGGGELFHADGRTERQTDMTKLIVFFFFAILRTLLEMNFTPQRKQPCRCTVTIWLLFTEINNWYL